jgi:hypothetical protein
MTYTVYEHGKKNGKIKVSLKGVPPPTHFDHARKVIYKEVKNWGCEVVRINHAGKTVSVDCGGQY